MKAAARGMRAAEMWAKACSKRTRVAAGVMAVILLGFYVWLLWSWVQYAG